VLCGRGEPQEVFDVSFVIDWLVGILACELADCAHRFPEGDDDELRLFVWLPDEKQGPDVSLEVFELLKTCPCIGSGRFASSLKQDAAPAIQIGCCPINI
jgi:hypothetical protein